MAFQHSGFRILPKVIKSISTGEGVPNATIQPNLQTLLSAVEDDRQAHLVGILFRLTVATTTDAGVIPGHRFGRAMKRIELKMGGHKFVEDANLDDIVHDYRRLTGRRYEAEPADRNGSGAHSVTMRAVLALAPNMFGDGALRGSTAALDGAIPVAALGPDSLRLTIGTAGDISGFVSALGSVSGDVVALLALADEVRVPTPWQLRIREGMTDLELDQPLHGFVRYLDVRDVATASLLDTSHDDYGDITVTIDNARTDTLSRANVVMADSVLGDGGDVDANSEADPEFIPVLSPRRGELITKHARIERGLKIKIATRTDHASSRLVWREHGTRTREYMERAFQALGVDPSRSRTLIRPLTKDKRPASAIPEELKWQLDSAVYWPEVAGAVARDKARRFLGG